MPIICFSQVSYIFRVANNLILRNSDSVIINVVNAGVNISLSESDTAIIYISDRISDRVPTIQKIPIDYTLLLSPVVSSRSELIDTLLSDYTNGINADVFIQDQYTDIIDRFMTRELSESTLFNNANYGDITLTLSSGHGFTNSPTYSEMIEINYMGNNYQSRVISVSGDVITVTNMIPFDIPSGTIIKRTSPDCNVDGSVTPVVFKVTPPNNIEWDIKVLSINMLDEFEMDDSKFGGITALTKGVVYQKTRSGKSVHILTAVDNSCYIRHCDIQDPYSSKAPAGLYGFTAKRYFSNDGITIRIGDGYEYIECIISDNLTGLTRFWNVVRGHRVE